MKNQLTNLNMVKEVAKKTPPKADPNCEHVKTGSKYQCTEIFNCCNCGGNDCGCGYCFSCKACDYCKENG